MRVKAALAGAAMALAGIPAASSAADETEPSARAAGIGWELNASDEVERVANRRYRSYNWLASCRSVSRTQFSCDVSGYKGMNFASGRATVRRLNRYQYKVTSFNVNFS